MKIIVLSFLWLLKLNIFKQMAVFMGLIRLTGVTIFQIHMLFLQKKGTNAFRYLYGSNSLVWSHSICASISNFGMDCNVIILCASDSSLWYMYDFHLCHIHSTSLPRIHVFFFSISFPAYFYRKNYAFVSYFVNCNETSNVFSLISFLQS